MRLEFGMLELSSPQWSELRHAYGSAADIPALLKALDGQPDAKGEDEPWFSLWSALAHQGDIYPASFAAVPHIVRALGLDPKSAPSTFFQFPAWVEICRQRNGVEIPEFLAPSYFSAIAKLPNLVAQAATRPWSEAFLRCALAAVAAAKGSADIAESVLELSPDVAAEFMEWLDER